jgi:uncharacterized protein (DUF1800 family)
VRLLNSIQRQSAWLALVCAIFLTTGCGAGGGDGAASGNAGATASGVDGSVPANDMPTTKSESARFLSQASFGPKQADIDSLTSSGYSAWLNAQFALAQNRHVTYFDQQLAAGITSSSNLIYESFWRQAVTGEDQLRQRLVFALSQLFVVSLTDSTVSNTPRGVAGYMDMLGANAFGNFRTLLQDVSLHPMMGIYLSHLRNQKEDPARGRVPDENYAREVMQLFTIGLSELNADGTVKLDSRNEPIDTYGNDDVTGLAKVFTGWSWAGPDKSDSRFSGGSAAPDREILPMQSYPKYHSVAEKRFLGTVIGAQGSANPEASLQVALDRLFNHPNVGPFIGKQLIQRLVTSNPSQDYVARVTAAFNNDGQGVRGDMKALIRAIYLDPEARDMAKLADPKAGKIREPILRMANWMRAANVVSGSGRFLIGATDDPGSSLGQTPMRSPSVFNFYRPGYLPPNTSIGSAGLVSPEMQITHETSVAGYLNTLRSAVQSGFGSNNPRDVQPNYAELLALANTPDALLEQVNMLLTYGQMSAALKAQIRDAVSSVTIPTNNTTNADAARRNRVMLALFLTLAAPEYLNQK